MSEHTPKCPKGCGADFVEGDDDVQYYACGSMFGGGQCDSQSRECYLNTKSGLLEENATLHEDVARLTAENAQLRRERNGYKRVLEAVILKNADAYQAALDAQQWGTDGRN